MAYTKEQIEDAIITALDPLKTSQGVRTLKSYGGDFEPEELVKLTAQFPALYVTYGGSQYSAHGATKIERMRFIVFVADKSLRTEGESRRGGSQNPGTYTLLEAVRDELAGSLLGLQVMPLRLESETPLAYAKGISIYAAEYTLGQTHHYP